MTPGSEVITTPESKAPSSLSAGLAFATALRGARPRSERISQRCEERPPQERPRSFPKRDHNGQGGAGGGCSGASTSTEFRRHTWQPERRGARVAEAGLPLARRRELPGHARRRPAPGSGSGARGALTLGTKSNLDLEPGEEWRRVRGGGGGGSGWAGEPRERGRSGRLGMGLGGLVSAKGGQEGGACPGGAWERGTRTSRIP